jgi:hypothetical protein
MGQTFPVGILLLEETGVPEETHESTASHRQTLPLCHLFTCGNGASAGLSEIVLP